MILLLVYIDYSYILFVPCAYHRVDYLNYSHQGSADGQKELGLLSGMLT